MDAVQPNVLQFNGLDAGQEMRRRKRGVKYLSIFAPLSSSPSNGRNADLAGQIIPPVPVHTLRQVLISVHSHKLTAVDTAHHTQQN